MSEIVRCKDCMHKYVTGITTQYYACYFMDAQFDENGYCHHGEKQVTSKLNNADDSLLTEDSEACKEQKSKLESEKLQLSQETSTNKVDTPTEPPTNAPTDTISRQAAIDAMEVVSDEICQWQAVEAIESLPPVEPKRPKGEWIEYIDDRNGRRYDECPSCHKTTLNAVDYDVLDGERHSMNFCPNCGADMRGVDDETD